MNNINYKGMEMRRTTTIDLGHLKLVVVEEQLDVFSMMTRSIKLVSDGVAVGVLTGEMSLDIETGKASMLADVGGRAMLLKDWYNQVVQSAETTEEAEGE